jgi:hypothetical protein
MLFKRMQHPSQADLSAYVDGELAVVQARSLAAHAEGCAECREALDVLRDTKALLAGLPRAMLPRSFVLSAAQAGLQQTRPTRQGPPALRLAPALSLAVLAVLLLVDVSLPANGDGSSADRDDLRPGLAAKSSEQPADSAAGAALQASPSAAAPSPLPRAANNDSSVVGATGPAAAPQPAPAPFAAGQAAQMDAQAQSGAPAALSQPESRAGASEAAPPVAPQPFAAIPGSEAGAAGAATPPASGASTAVPAQPQQQTPRTSENDGDDANRNVLRLFEVLAAVAFIASLLVYFSPRLTRKEP